ncbi:MAG: hypothetical protein JXA44_06255 [Methanospirillaceae archaeon]|nr:hypothetical protein [Methanospirillaceae archaeon]
MDSDEQALYKAIGIASVIGVAICLVLIIYVTTSDYFYQGFSELYCSEECITPPGSHNNSSHNCSITIVSHHKEQMGYEYRISLNDTVIQSGTFQLPGTGSDDAGITIPFITNTVSEPGRDLSSGFIDKTKKQEDTSPVLSNRTDTRQVIIQVNETTSYRGILPRSYCIFFPVTCNAHEGE